MYSSLVLLYLQCTNARNKTQDTLMTLHIKFGRPEYILSITDRRQKLIQLY